MPFTELFKEYAKQANEQMAELIQFHEDNKDALRYGTWDFVPDTHYNLDHIGFTETKLYAVFNTHSWEYSSTYYLDLKGGFEDEMALMKNCVEKRKRFDDEEDLKEEAAQRAQYEALKARFENE